MSCSALVALSSACSSSDASSAADDAGADVVVEASSRDVIAPAICEAVTPDRPSRNVPARPRNPSACSPAQIRGYAQACLVDFEKPAVCDAYAKQNPGCFACIHSTEDSADFGPIIFFRDRQYFDLNTAGCVAHQLGDLSDTGCGAAEGRYQDCTRRSCRGCSSEKTQAARDELFACLDSDDLGTTCASERAETTVACDAVFQAKPNDPVLSCFWEGDGFAEAIVYYMEMWCGVVSDAGTDGGVTDGGDAGAADADAADDADAGGQ